MFFSVLSSFFLIEKNTEEVVPMFRRIETSFSHIDYNKSLMNFVQ